MPQDLRTPTEQRAYTGWQVASLRMRPGYRWSQGELGDRVNDLMDTAYWNADRISTLERGVTRLPSEWIPAFAVVLGVTAAELLGIDPEDPGLRTGSSSAELVAAA
jgi:hypothetical protein